MTNLNLMHAEIIRCHRHKSLWFYLGHFRYILRNWIAQKAISMAEEDDFSEVKFLLDLFRNPYKINKAAEGKGYASKPPSWSKTLSVSCSS